VCDHNSGDVFPLGHTQVDCHATDKAGNTASDSFGVTVVDTTAPVLALPNAITKEATSPSGAVVVFGVTATDLLDGPVAAVCSPVSGTTFPIGTTTVHCSASDKAGNAARGQFDVVVNAVPAPGDTTPPAITVPAPISANAIRPEGAPVTFTVSALDAVDGAVPVSCSKGSGALFPIGTTTVDCSAHDAAGNAASKAFTVHVAGGPEQLEALIADVNAQRIGPGTSIADKLDAALTALEAGSQKNACRALDQAARLGDGNKKLTQEQAAWLQGEIARIQRVIAC
jgi:hypothetical protein